MIVFIVSFSFFIIACSNASNDNNKLEVLETTQVSKDNFYEFINEFEYINYHENGNIKEYNYVSPKSGDTLFRFFYDQEGNPLKPDHEKQKIYIASQEFNDGKTIKYLINPPKFYCRIRVYNSIENEDILIDTSSCILEYNVYDLQRVEILFTIADSVYNRPIYQAEGFEKKNFDSIKFENSVFIFE